MTVGPERFPRCASPRVLGIVPAETCERVGVRYAPRFTAGQEATREMSTVATTGEIGKSKNRLEAKARDRPMLDHPSRRTAEN